MSEDRGRWQPLLWILPCLLCLALYWPGLMAWFQQDDFVWLNMPNQAHGWNGLLRALFQPNPVQGSWRPLPERAFFLVFTPLFGADALPYHVWIFLTQCANLVLVSSVTGRITRSRAAGLGAATLWVANSKLATAMAWASAYNQVLCAFFLLLALHFFVRFTESGARRDYTWTWLVFLSGFLAMETNVIFPLLAAAYAAGCAHRYLRHTLPWFGVSAAYAILHFLVSPNHAPAYRIHLDASLLATFWTYWRGTFEPVDVRFLPHFWRIFSYVELAAASVALLGFTVCEALRRQWLAAVMLAWYVITLLPVLPLRDHIMEYYLTLPAMAMAMLAAYALCRAWSTRWKAVAIILTAGFLVTSLPAARRRAEWNRVRSERQEDVVMGVAHAHRLHPGKVILLDGVDDSLFSQLISQRPFLFLGIPDVYLAPGAGARIGPHPEWGGLASFELSAADTARGLDRGAIVVYRVESGSLRNITREFAASSGNSSVPR